MLSYDQEQYRTLAKDSPRVENQSEEIKTPGVEMTSQCIEKADQVGMDDAMRQRNAAVGL